MLAANPAKRDVSLAELGAAAGTVDPALLARALAAQEVAAQEKADRIAAAGTAPTIVQE
jgi:hypothetical protein